MSITPDIRYSGNARITSVNAHTAPDITGAINAIKNLLILAGWSLNGVGEFAVGTITVLAIPFHNGADGGPPQNGALFRNMGFYSQGPGGLAREYILFDPYAFPEDPDPTNGLNVGVPVGHSANETVINFCAKLSANTDYGCSPGNPDGGGNFQTVFATAKSPGPDSNDPNWLGDGANCFTAGCRLGGWDVKSVLYKGTQITLKIIENANQALEITCFFSGSPLFATTADASDPAAINKVTFLRAIAGPYQFLLLEDASQIFPSRFIACVPWRPDNPTAVTYAAFSTIGIVAGSGSTNNLYTAFGSAVKVTSSVGQSGFKKGTYSGIGIQSISLYGLDSGTDTQPVTTSIGKPLILSPFVGLSVVDSNALSGETRIVGQMWDSCLVTSYQQLDTLATIDNRNFLAIARNSGPVTATLYIAVSNDLG